MNNFNHYNGNNIHSKNSLQNNLKSVNSVISKTNASKKELAKTLDTMGKLKGDKKEAYVGELISRANSIAFATDLLNFMDSAITHTSKLDQITILGYQKTISKLLDRLEKLNEKENPDEIENIYYLIADLSNKILEVNKDTKKMIMAVITSAITVAGLVLKPVIEKNIKKL